MTFREPAGDEREERQVRRILRSGGSGGWDRGEYLRHCLRLRPQGRYPLTESPRVCA